MNDDAGGYPGFNVGKNSSFGLSTSSIMVWIDQFGFESPPETRQSREIISDLPSEHLSQQEFAERPDMIGQPQGHGRSSRLEFF